MNVDALANEYAKLKLLIKNAEEKAARYKQMLMEKVEAEGDPDEKGNIWLQGTEWLLKREKRVKATFDEKAAMEWVEELEDGDGIIVTVTPEPYDMVDRDALAAYAFLHRDDPEVQAKVKSFHGEDVTWAFAPPVKQEKIDY